MAKLSVGPPVATRNCPLASTEYVEMLEYGEDRLAADAGRKLRCGRYPLPFATTTL